MTEELKQKAEKSRLSTKNGHDLSYDPKYREVYDKAYIAGATEATKELEAQIEKMKCCGNCKYGYCGGSSISIDKDGNRTFHNWNEEKQDYCDVGKNGKYQCWELRR